MAMKRRQLILDLSHMADQAVADAFALWRGPIMASHSNSRELVPGDRQVTDQTVAEIAQRGGVVGVSFYRDHLRRSGRATLDDVAAACGAANCLADSPGRLREADVKALEPLVRIEKLT